MNYAKRCVALIMSSLLLLIAISFIPPQSLFGVELTRANILSEIVEFHSEAEELVEVDLELDEEEYEVDMTEVVEAVVATNDETMLSDRDFSWVEEEPQPSAKQEPKSGRGNYNRSLPEVKLTPIEDFDTTDNSRLRALYQRLIEGDSTVRIALLGDSFVEADILSCDLRATLQNHFGGCGAGFAPTSSPLTYFRPTIKTTSKGWESYNIMQRRSTPEFYADNYSVSGWVCSPSQGASVKWSCASPREHLDSCQRVRILFLSPNDSEVEVTINDSESKRFSINGGSALRQIELSRDDICSVDMRVVSAGRNFIGYGAIFEGREGVVLDNYSVRSNNGQAMLWTNPAINAQIDRAIGGYDLVILQYGLNIMQKGVTNYTRYGAQVEKMIAYARECFPRAAIVVMGVSDRSMKSDGEYQPMVEAPRLTEYQRAAAKAAGAAFWSTYDAMQAQGGMSHFVEMGWAGKDFTHINFNGGRQVAWALGDAILEGVALERGRAPRHEEYKPVISEREKEVIYNEFMPSQEVVEL